MLSTTQIFLMISASTLSLSSTLHLIGAHHIIADKIDQRNQRRHLKAVAKFFINEELPGSNTILLALKVELYSNCGKIETFSFFFIVKKCCHLIEFKRVTEFFLLSRKKVRLNGKSFSSFLLIYSRTL